MRHAIGLAIAATIALGARTGIPVTGLQANSSLSS